MVEPLHGNVVANPRRKLFTYTLYYLLGSLFLFLAFYSFCLSWALTIENLIEHFSPRWCYRNSFSMFTWIWGIILMTPGYLALYLISKVMFPDSWKRRFSLFCAHFWLFIFWLFFPLLLVVISVFGYFHIPYRYHLTRSEASVVSGDPTLIENREIHYNDKPVIYLYPKEESKILVQLKYKGSFTFTYPQYNSEILGWQVTAKPTGELSDDEGSTYSYLFWEGLPDYQLPLNPEKGFIVKGEDTAKFLAKVLPKFGLTPKEYNEFIVYWHPRMMKNPYNHISFSGAEYEELAPLSITPAPDTIIRVMMVYKGLKERPDREPAPLEIKKKERKGFVAVEWGGTEIR